MRRLKVPTLQISQKYFKKGQNGHRSVVPRKELDRQKIRKLHKQLNRQKDKQAGKYPM